MGYRLSKRSINRLFGVHCELVLCVQRALQLCEVDFGVSEGIRSMERQNQLYDSGASRTLSSKHLTGDAVDLFAWVDGAVSWEMRHYEPIAEAMKLAADELDISIEWGGDWQTFKDGPHFQRV